MKRHRDTGPTNDGLPGLAVGAGHDEVYARLVAAAREEFLEQGFAGATVEAIARKAGISKKTVYRYANSKEALLFETLSDAFQEMFSPIFASEGARMGRAELGRCLVELCLLSASHEGLTIYRLVLSEARQLPEMALAYRRALEAHVLAPLTAWIGGQSDQGRLRVDDPRLAAGMLWAMVVSPYMRDLSLGVRSEPKREEVERVVNTALNMFHVGFATRLAD